MKKRHATLLGVGAGALAALVAHAVYWYLPRERPAVPSAVARAELGAERWAVAVWVPYPHQNLGLLERRTGDLRRWLEMVSPRGRAAGRRLPRFGPWLVPPSRELLVAESDDELAVELDVYPAVALLARASGAVARNPWLAGGEVGVGGGRRASVSWSGRRWRLRTTPAVEAPPAAGAEASLALVRLRLSRGVAGIPAGDYRIERGPESLELRSGPLPDPAAPPLGVAEPLPAAWRVERTGRGAVRGTILWQEPGAMPPFPAALTLQRGGGRGPRLPGEELLRVAGGEPRARTVAGFDLRALATPDLDAGAPLAGELSDVFSERRGITLYAGFRPVRLALAARRVAGDLRGLPLGRLLGVDPGELAAWISPLGGCPVSVLEIREAPRAVRWRLCLDEPAAAPPR